MNMAKCVCLFQINMYCPFCGHILVNSPKFCGSCGRDTKFIIETASDVCAGEDHGSTEIVSKGNIMFSCLYFLCRIEMWNVFSCQPTGQYLNPIKLQEHSLSLCVSVTDACAKSAVTKFMTYREMKEKERKTFSKSTKKSKKTVMVS